MIAGKTRKYLRASSCLDVALRPVFTPVGSGTTITISRVEQKIMSQDRKIVITHVRNAAEQERQESNVRKSLSYHNASMSSVAPARIGLIETRGCIGLPCIVVWTCTGDCAVHYKTVLVTYKNPCARGMQYMDPRDRASLANSFGVSKRSFLC